MFHWICPECGREIPPALKECPACDPQREQLATPVAVLPAAVSETIVAAIAAPPPPREVPAAAPVLSSAPVPQPAAEPSLDPLLAMAERVRAAQAAVEKPPAPEPDIAPQIRELAAAVGEAEIPTLEMIPVPAIATAERVQPRELLAAPQMEAAPAPVALAEPLPAPEEIRETMVQPVDLAEPESTPLPSIAPANPVPVPRQVQEEVVQPAALSEPASTPLPSIATADPVPVPKQVQEEAVQPVALAEPDSAPLPSMALANPVPDSSPAPAEIRAEVASPAALAKPVPSPAPPPLVPEQPRPHPMALAALAEPFPSTFPPPSAPQAPAGLRPEPLVQASAAPPVPETPSDRPPSGSWLKFAPLQDYSAAATRAMRPAAPPAKILSADSGPRMTLPGPALPPQLNVRENLQVLTVHGGRPHKARGIPGWLISFLVMTGLLAVGIVVVTYLLPASHSTADAKTAAPEPVTAPVADVSHPLAQSIEVTGIRFVMDLNKKSEIHYLVVNHSGAELSDMNVFVTVRAANAKPGQPPLCRFSFRSTGLGAFESKEMISPIEKLARPVTLPDWHDLRAEVQIAQ